jgi:uncharacterized protein
LQDFLLPRGIKPTISVTVTGFNAYYVAEVIEWILENELPFSLNFYRENSQINQANKEKLILEEKAIINGMLKAYQLIENSLPTYPILDSLLDKFHSTAHRYTCGVDQNYLVVDQQGKIAQCQMQLHNSQLNVIQNLAVEEKTKCNQCLYRYRCSGGCPLETFRAHGRWDMPSPNCHIYQALYPEALRLEGLRLIKKGH